MNRSGPILPCALVVAGALALSCMPALADQAAPAVPEREADYSPGFDWIGHTQRTLDDLKGKLNLAPAQAATWDTWSGGVMKDARQQLEQRKPWLEEDGPGAEALDDGPTPERMARGIERLRAETAWMEQHLTQLQAAQVRTKAFYEALDKNQRTIFDLFWHEVDRRAGGFEGEEAMNPRDGSGSCGP